MHDYSIENSVFLHATSKIISQTTRGHSGTPGGDTLRAFPVPLHCDFLSLPGTCRLPGEESLTALWPSPRPTGLPLSLAHCEDFQGIRLLPAWGFHDSPASSIAGKTPTQGLAILQLRLPLPLTFTKDNPLEEMCSTSCQRSREFSIALGPWGPSGNMSGNCRCGGWWRQGALCCLGPCWRGICRVKVLITLLLSQHFPNPHVSHHSSLCPCTRLQAFPCTDSGREKRGIDGLGQNASPHIEQSSLTQSTTSLGEDGTLRGAKSCKCQ